MYDDITPTGVGRAFWRWFWVGAWEGDVFTVSGAAEWDTATHSVKVIGAPTAAIHTAPPAKAK